MAETEIVRIQVIVVKKVWEAGVGAYPYFFWTDEKDKEYKVPEKRKEYFEGVITPNAVVQLNYAEYKGKEYVYSAEAVKDKLPDTIKKDAKIEALEAEQMGKGNPRTKQTAENWVGKVDPQRKSIERQTAIKAAVELNRGMPGTTAATAIMDAQLIEYYLETGALKGKPNLVEEAKKLGAKGITEEMPF